MPRAYLRVQLDEHEALPRRAPALGLRAEAAQKAFPELEDFLRMLGEDERLRGGSGGVGQDDMLEFVAAGRNDGGAFVYLGWIEQIENREMLNGKNFVHAFEAEAALLVEKVGDVGLAESSLAGQMESGELSGFDSGLKDFAQIVLEDFELHLVGV